jgi:hypothetical protein
MQLLFRLLSLPLLLLLVPSSYAHSSASASPTAVNDNFDALRNCENLFKTAKSPEELAELQKDYWTLLGMVQQLSFYRQTFISQGNLIDLFPTAYYHTTLNELSRINKNEYKYPIEKMKQMIAFFDAYEKNRVNWNNRNITEIELHWLNHFTVAERWQTYENIGKDVKATLELEEHSSISFVFTLASAVNAHVQYDLPRAIRFAYDNRFDKNLTFRDLNDDFIASNVLFEETTTKTTSDLRQVNSDWTTDLDLGINNAMVKLNKALKSPELGKAKYLLDSSAEALISCNTLVLPGGVEVVRKKAWEAAETSTNAKFTDFYGTNILSRQPVLPHQVYVLNGKEICPPVPITVNNAAPALPAGLIGANSPEELGTILLNALKNNNQKLWNRYFHPAIASATWMYWYKDVAFLRQRFLQEGFTQWESIKFKRVTYGKGIEGREDPLEDNETHYMESWTNHYTIEFTCGRPGYVGSVTGLVLSTYQGQRYFIRGSGMDAHFKKDN